jgi:hypothetical protein
MDHVNWQNSAPGWWRADVEPIVCWVFERDSGWCIRIVRDNGQLSHFSEGYGSDEQAKQDAGPWIERAVRRQVG